MSHTAVQRWARGAGVGLAMGAVGARRPGGRPAQAGGVRGPGGRGRAGRGRPGRGRVDPGRGQVVARYVYEYRRPPRCRRRAPGMAVRSCVEGGAGAPCGHRITGDPTRGCRGGAGRGLRLGAAGAGHDRHGPGAGGLGPPSSPAGSAGAGRPCRARSAVGRAWGGVYRPAAAQAAARAPLARPKIRKPAPTRPCASGSSTCWRIGSVPGRSPPVCGSRTPMMGACAPVREQIHPGARVRSGRRQPARPVAGAIRALRTGRTRRIPRSPLAGLPKPRGKEPDTGAPPTGLRPPEADEGAVPGHWEGDLVIGAGGRSALITLVERTSRFVLISRLGTCHDSATVTDALQTMVADLPRAVYSTITWDQGAQMAQHAAFTAITGIPVYFADPHSPRSASHQREHQRADPRVLPQGHQLHRRHRHPGPGRPGPAQPPPTRSLERTDPHRDTGHHHQRCNHHLTPPCTLECKVHISAPGGGADRPESGVIAAAAVRAGARVDPPGARGGAVCPNLPQRPGSRRSTERE